MEIEIKKLSTADLEQFKELIAVFEIVFEMEKLQLPKESYLQQLLEKESFFVFVALSDNEVVGGLTSYTLQQYYSERPLVYIYDLAVKTEFQRQGIGRMLMLSVTNYCRQIGVEEVFVQAEEADGYAIEFYHSTGGLAEKVVHFNYPLDVKHAGE